MAPKRFPSRAVALDVQFGDRRLNGGRPRQVLLVGEIPPGLRLTLVQRGAELTLVSDLHDAFLALAEHTYDVVAVSEFAGQLGLDFVNAIKEAETEHQLTLATLYGARGDAQFLAGVRPPPAEALDAARARHHLTPFVLLPPGGVGDYAVIVVPPHASFLENTHVKPVASTILTADPRQLLMRAEALA